MTDVDVILACHEFRCAWDHEATWYVAQDRTGRRIWERRARCLRGCGSERTDRQPPVLTAEITSRNYYRPPGWAGFGRVYVSRARAERLRRQKKGMGIK